MIKLGITGGLSSGKTTVAKMFKELGARVLDADRIAHRAIYKNSLCYRRVIKAFGELILNPDSSINRKKLAKVAFKNKKNQQKLCDIVHPWVLKYINKKLYEYSKTDAIKISVVDAALLVESGLYQNMDSVLIVKSTPQQQIERAFGSKKISVEQAKQRMGFQLPLNKKIKYADYVVDNRGNLTQTKAQVKKIWKESKLRV
ncbi:MAG: dephospho-CoA kinase [PVC group bacterium]|nr:dephospho-CoA kinase [PVC group bacterium]